MTVVTTLTKTLQEHGYSLTRPRKLVFDQLTGAEPLAMRDLLAALQGKIDRASLYRTVALFEGLGIVQRLYIGFKYKIELTDLYSHHHHHVSCLKCGKVVPLSEHEKIERMITLLAKRHGVRATSHQLEIQGYCSECEA